MEGGVFSKKTLEIRKDDDHCFLSRSFDLHRLSETGKTPTKPYFAELLGRLDTELERKLSSTKTKTADTSAIASAKLAIYHILKFLKWIPHRFM